MNKKLSQSRNKNKNKISKKRKRDALNEEQFKRLSWKMIGLSNMLSLMNVTKGPHSFMPRQNFGASKLGGIN
jgi:hypothetical protein